MNKGLRALEEIKKALEAEHMGLSDIEEIKIIEKELKDLEFLKELFKSIVVMKENGFPILELKCNEETMKKLKEVLL